MIVEINKRKQEFYDIFDKVPKSKLNHLTGNGKITYDVLIMNNLDFWIMSRIRGISAGLSLDCAIIDAIKLIDKIAIEYFQNKNV
jgi:hypothetical protein